MQKPVHERFCVVLVTETKECVYREGGVSQPGEAIVPVQIAADALRQRGRWRGDNRTRGRIGKQFESERAAHDVLLVRATIIRTGTPFPPPIPGEL